MLVGSLTTPTFVAAVRPRAAAAVPDQEPRVELGTCPKSPVNPWPELNDLGLVASASMVGGISIRRRA